MQGEPLYLKGAHLPLLRRFVNANKQRARAEALLRYNLYIDSMPIDDLPALNSDQVSSGSGCSCTPRKPSSRRRSTTAVFAAARYGGGCAPCKASSLLLVPCLRCAGQPEATDLVRTTQSDLVKPDHISCCRLPPPGQPHPGTDAQHQAPQGPPDGDVTAHRRGQHRLCPRYEQGELKGTCL
jgi:hypothetical protein